MGLQVHRVRNYGANTKRDLLQLFQLCGWFSVVPIKGCSGVVVTGIRVVRQSQCFCRQAHNHHRNILNRQHYTELHVLVNRAAHTQGGCEVQSARLTLAVSAHIIADIQTYFPPRSLSRTE